MGTPIRVVLVDDSSLARAVLRDILEADGGFQIIAEAANGRQAVELVAQHRPDLVTMDLEMPVMGGLQAITEIMAQCAVPILVVSGAADAQSAYDAVAHGALDVVAKPGMDVAEAAAFVAKARLVSSVRVITHVRTAVRSATVAPVQPPLGMVPPSGLLFAIASSTGGPQALARLLTGLPKQFCAPILISQHISDGFAAGMADWLNGLSPLPVRLAVDGQGIEPGCVYLSPSECSLAVGNNRRIVLLPRREGDIYHPTCDVLLDSAAAVYGRRSVGIILTGMGRDGARGMQTIRLAGGRTIAQDEASSVIFGMNQVAIASGCIDRILPLDAISAAMIGLCHGETP